MTKLISDAFNNVYCESLATVAILSTFSIAVSQIEALLRIVFNE